MIDKCLYEKVSREAAFLFLFLIGSLSALASFAKPDFAYPKTVQADASVVFDKSVASGDWNNALKASIQLSIAESLISQDNFMKGVENFEIIATKAPAPWRNLAYLIEGKMYAQLYQSKRWIFDSREVSADSISNNPMEWDKNLFKDKIEDLLIKSLQDSAHNNSLPISDIQTLLSDYGDAVKYGISVGDFIDMEAVEISGIFGNESQKQYLTYVNGKCENSNPGKEAYLTWFKYTNSPDRKVVLNQALEKFGDTKYATPFLLDKSFEGDTACYKELSAYMKKFPDCVDANAIKNRISSLLTQSLSFSCDGQYISGTDFTVKLKSRNLSKFNVLVLRLPDNQISKEIKLNEIAGLGKVVKSISCDINGLPAEEVERELIVSGLPQGVYTMVASTNADLSGLIKGVYSRRSVPTFLISDIALFTVNDTGKDKFGRLYVVDAKNQKPISGAKVQLTSTDRKQKRVLSLLTDKDGKVDVPKSGWDVSVVSGKNRIQERVWGFEQSRGKSGVSKNVKILTDLSLYHPGEKAQFVAIAYEENNRMLHTSEGNKILLKLRDPDWKDVDSLQLITDKSGRAVGEFVLPKTGKLGSYSISAILDNYQVGSTSLMVAEYKAPKFYIAANVEQKPTEISDSVNNVTVTIAGVIKNYSGVAEGNAKVQYVVQALPWRWGYVSGNDKISGECVANEKGEFTIELKSTELPVISNGYGREVATPYVVNISASNAAGETAEAAPLRFVIGEGKSIQATIPSRMEVEKKIVEFKVAILDPLGNQDEGEIFYQILNDNKAVVRSGSFKSPVFNCDVENLSSGRYKFKFALNDDFSVQNKDSEESEIILYRVDDKKPPISTPLWVPTKTIELEPNAKSVEIRFGSSFPGSWIFVQVADCDSILYSKCIENNGVMGSLRVNAPKSNSRLFVTLSGLHELKQEVCTVTLVPSEQVEPIVVKAVSFRDKITPNGKERWSFLFEKNGEAMRNLSVICVMSDKSLNAIQPFRWNFNPTNQIYYPNLNNISYNGYGRYNWYLQITQSQNLPTSPFSYPYIDQYGYTVYSGIRVRGGVMANGVEKVYNTSAKISLATVKDESYSQDSYAEVDMVKEAAAVEGDAGSSSPASQENVSRTAEQPLAFFKPCLQTNENGEMALEFEAPDFLGSWQFQMIGYSTDMKSVYWSKDIESSKPLMVRINYPRFLRIGDNARITSTIYNNSDTVVSASGRIEIFNPISKEITKTNRIESLRIEKNSSAIVDIEYQPTLGEPFGIRVVVESGKYSDGEQMLVPVFLSSELIKEGETYYFSPDQKEALINVSERLRKQKVEDRSLTLSFCADPLWECVKALPEIKTSETFNSLKVADNIFAIGLENKLITDNPRFVDVMNDYNLSKSQSDLDTSINQLGNLQQGDGGWSWCKGMRSSEFVTLRVLQMMGRLKVLGAMPKEVQNMTSKGLNYLDAKTIENVNKYQRTDYPFLSLLDYLWVRDQFDMSVSDAMLKRIIGNVVEAVRKDWKKLSIEQKSKAAVVLNAHGYPMVAREILESLRQYATVTPKGGMWFDNIRDMGNTPLAITCLTLDAYVKLQPESADVDQLRQWILLNKQTRNWGNGADAVNAIYSILNSGTKWISDNTPEVKVYVDGSELMVPTPEKYTGAFTVKLPVDANNVKVVRSGDAPAWGGVLMSYVAPIKDVKAYSSEDLKVEKQIVAPSTLKVGDKVRVNLIVTNKRAMDMVEIRDGLGAYLLPEDQLSGYYVSDGIWMYKEVGKSNVNLFIESLPKGTHVFSYECTVTHAGTYSEGLVSGQCVIYPVITAHSAGIIRSVE